jgi:hypothetical protein
MHTNEMYPGVRWIHLRYRSTSGDVYSRGGATIAYIHEGALTHATIAKCHRNDNFSRRTGRAISANRLMNGVRDITIITPYLETEDTRKIDGKSLYETLLAGLYSAMPLEAHEDLDNLG